MSSFGSALGIAHLVTRSAAHGRIHDHPSTLKAPVAIVPGASVYRKGIPSPHLRERLQSALALFRDGRVKRVLVSGARRPTYDETGPMRRWLIQNGVPSSAIDVDPAGFRTLDTMFRAAEVFGVRHAIVCTQRYHLPRAIFLARRAGIDAVGLAADPPHATTAWGDRARESLAAVVALADTYLLRTKPHAARAMMW